MRPPDKTESSFYRDSAEFANESGQLAAAADRLTDQLARYDALPWKFSDRNAAANGIRSTSRTFGSAGRPDYCLPFFAFFHVGGWLMVEDPLRTPRPSRS